MKPEISVIVPIYNVEKYVAQCIESIISQTITDIEIILIDDCSTDNSYEIAKNYAEKDSRIVLYKNKINSKVSKTRNFGLDNAKGKYIAFIDADDYIESTFLETLYSNTTRNKQTLFSVSYYLVKDNKVDANLTSGNFDVSNNLLEVLAYYNTNKIKLSHAVWGKLYKKEILDKYKIRFPEDIFLREDFLFNIEYLSYIKNYICDNTPLYYYRQVSTSVTKKFDYDIYVEQEKKVISYAEKRYQFLSSILTFKAIQYIVRMVVFNKDSELNTIIKDEFFRSRLNFKGVKGLNIEKKLIYLFYKLKSKMGLKLTINIAHYYYKLKEKLCSK